MRQCNIAIIGLGRVGTLFLEEMLLAKQRGINVAAVVERERTKGMELAEREGITVHSMASLLESNECLDFIFDLSGNPRVRTKLRNGLCERNNQHTIVVPEAVGRLIWQLTCDDTLPDVHDLGPY